MAFIDDVIIEAHAGRGGNGVVRWLRTKETARGGPSGGDGGHGGDVVLVGARDLAALSQYRFEKYFKAEDGEHGKSELKRGKDGDSMLLTVPVGTVARVIDTEDEYEITREGETVVIFRGGAGGKGNARFKSSTHQNPFEFTPGKEGRGGKVRLMLKLIADAGLIGLPNAGKSSLLNALTRAKSKVGSYPFTTLEPNLGDFYGHILADIPGLIEGASEGKGLGIKFLQHVERTGILLHLISSEQENPVSAYREVRRELEAFGRGLPEKRELVVLSKTDLVPDDELQIRHDLLERELGTTVLHVSVHKEEELKHFADKLTEALRTK
jgi:GTP-binding protein